MVKYLRIFVLAWAAFAVLSISGALADTAVLNGATPLAGSNTVDIKKDGDLEYAELYKRSCNRFVTITNPVSVNALVATSASVPRAALAPGDCINFIPLSDNTSTVTLAEDATAATALDLPNGSALAAGDLKAGTRYTAWYISSTTDWRVESVGSGSGHAKSAATSLRGVASTSSAEPADITASADGQYPARRAGSITFAAPTAAEIVNTPAGNIAAINVQTAVNELDTEKQPVDPDLTCIAGLTSSADQLPYFTGSGTCALTTLTSFMRTLIDDTTSANARITLGVVIGTNVQAWDADLDCIAANSTTGFMAYTGAGTCAYRTWGAPAAGITISNPAGTAGNPSIALANDLAALEGISTNGVGVRTGTDTWTTRQLVAPAAGITITNPAGIAGDFTFALADDLSALEGLACTGYAKRTATSVWSCPSITGADMAANTVGYGQFVQASAAGIICATASGNWGQCSVATTKTLLAIAASDVSGLATIATSGSATDLASGTVNAARLPNFVNGNTAGNGIAVTQTPAQGFSPTIAFDFSDPGANPALAANTCRFQAPTTVVGFLVCEGATADNFETYFKLTDPTADRTVTFPDADSVTIQPQTCGSTDKVSGVSAAGVITCSGDVGAGGGSTVTINSGAQATANLNDTTPAAAGGGYNMKWQASGNNVSAYLDINGATTDSSPDPTADYLMSYDASAAATKKVLMNVLLAQKTESFCIALSDETTAITTGTAKATMRMPYAFTLTGIRGNLNTVSSSGSPIFDVKKNGTSIMTTNKILIDVSEKTSVTAVTAPTLTTTALSDDDEMTFDINTAGTGAKGAKVCLIGHQ